MSSIACHHAFFPDMGAFVNVSGGMRGIRAICVFRCVAIRLCKWPHEFHWIALLFAREKGGRTCIPRIVGRMVYVSPWLLRSLLVGSGTCDCGSHERER